jgi:hypothetical protein
MSLIYGEKQDGVSQAVRIDDAGRLEVALGTLAGEMPNFNRIFTAEVWDYGSGNLDYNATGTTPQQLRTGPGVLGQVQVIAADSGVTLTFYDNASGQASGTVLGIVDCGTAGTSVRFGRPFSNGLVAAFSGGTDPKTAVVAVGRL